MARADEATCPVTSDGQEDQIAAKSTKNGQFLFMMIERFVLRCAKMKTAALPRRLLYLLGRKEDARSSFRPTASANDAEHGQYAEHQQEHHERPCNRRVGLVSRRLFRWHELHAPCHCAATLGNRCAKRKPTKRKAAMQLAGRSSSAVGAGEVPISPDRLPGLTCRWNRN